jgi:hypothetical protein
MKKDRRNAWSIPTGLDTFHNSALIAVGLVGLLLAVLTGGGVA